VAPFSAHPDPRVTSPPPPPPGLLRRLAAVLYDSLLVVALLMVATALFLPFTGGEAIDPHRDPLLEWTYRGVLLLIVVGFFGIFWTGRGQTLGMASWRLRVEREDGGNLNWGDTIRRLAASLLSWVALGLGWLWILVDPQRRAWHDRLSRTRMVLVDKKTRRR
jgi:uncharacterized RDD family membrane protein YckC